MSKEDITPDGSMCPVFRDDTPLAPVGPPPIPDVDPDKEKKRTALDKLVKKAGLDSEDVRVLFGHGLEDLVEPPLSDPAQATAVGKVKATPAESKVVAPQPGRSTS